MAIISFEGIARDNEMAEIPDGYRNLRWTYLAAVDDDILNAGIGSNNAVRTGEAAAYSESTSTGFRSFERADDFDLNKGYFTTLSESGSRVKVFGFDDGERVATVVFNLDPSPQFQQFVKFGAQFDDIDQVKFKTDAGFFLDDLFIV